MSTDNKLQALSDQLNRIEMFTQIGSKSILNMAEAAVYTGFTKAFLYKQTSDRAIPHFKKNRKVLFKKQELDDWLTENRIRTDAEINSKATTYVALHKR